MHSSYKVLFRLSFRHGYFSDGRLRQVDVVPAAATGLLLQRYGLFLKRTEDGVMVVYDALFAGSVRERETVLPASTVLRFLFAVPDPAFWNFTGNVSAGSPLHFHTAYSDGDAARLHKTETVSSDDVDPEVAQVLIPGTQRRPTGIIDLTISEEPLPEVFFMAFATRVSIWRYILLSSHLRALDGPVVRDKADAIEFSGPEEILLPDLQSALRFTALRSLPLLQKPNLNFQLVENYAPEDGRQKVVIPVLPNPDVRRFAVTDGSRSGAELFQYSDIIL